MRTIELFLFFVKKNVNFKFLGLRFVDKMLDEKCSFALILKKIFEEGY